MSLTLKSLIGQFLKWAEGALAPATVRSYAHHLKRFVVAVKNKQVKKLKPVDLTARQRSWHEWQAVQRLFHWGVHEAKLVRSNPFDNVRSPRRGQRKRILTPRDIARFLRGSRRAWRQFIMALRELAARPQEVRALCWEQLRAQNPETPVEQALSAGTAVFVLHEFKDVARRRDSEMPRVLLVTRRLGRLLLRLRSQLAPAEGQVFRNTRGKPWTRNAVRLMFRSLRRRLGFGPDERGERVVAYTVRHSAATLASAQGVGDRVLADWLGHVETRTTRRYQHLNVGHIREALRRMERPGRDLAANLAARSATPK